MTTSIALASPHGPITTTENPQIRTQSSQSAVYQEVIDGASRDEMWNAVMGLCTVNEDWKKYFAETLTNARLGGLGTDVPEKTFTAVGKRKELADVNLEVTKSDKKKEKAERKNAKLEVCGKCGDVLPVTCAQDEDNLENCVYHDGYLEVDDENEFWADHDEKMNVWTRLLHLALDVGSHSYGSNGQ